MTTPSAPDHDGYRTVKEGERCPKCGQPGVRRVRTFGLLVETIMVHSTTGRGFAGCIIKEELIR